MSIERVSNSSDHVRFTNNPEDPTEQQLVVTGRLKQSKTKKDVEFITFTVRLGFFELVCIVNIPQALYADAERKDSERDPETAPCYIKFKLVKPRADTSAHN